MGGRPGRAHEGRRLEGSGLSAQARRFRASIAAAEAQAK
jgi:hypothetical protein